ATTEGTETDTPNEAAETSSADPEPETPAAEIRPQSGHPAETREPTPTVATPATPDAPSVEDLKAIKERFGTDHPELVPVMDAFLKEAQRGLNRKFEQVAALKKEAAEQFVSDE